MGAMIDLLRELVRTPSVSKEEHATASIIERELRNAGAYVERIGNNVVSLSRNYHTSTAPCILLNSHHDTVRASGGWTVDPHSAVIDGHRVIGLGSNDAGGALVMMLQAYLHFQKQANLPVRLMFAATAEEEISGDGGMALLAREWYPKNPIDVAIVGEPTGMQLAVAEKGLMVLDCVVHGRTGHAARNEGVNALYEALPYIEWFRTHQFSKTSPVLGAVKMTVTQIDAGWQHNVVPDTCRFVVDVRVTDAYTNEEILEEIQRHVNCTITPRSTRLAPSSIPLDHPLVLAGREMGLATYGSPTMSDQSLLPHGVPSLKIGPGDSARSHTPDEWLGIQELEDGTATFITLLENAIRRMQ